MKKIIFLFNCMFCLSILLQAQITAPRTYTISKQIDTTKNQSLQIKSINTKKDITEKLPDLRFTALNAIAIPYLDNGVTKYKINLTYTVKNDGDAPVLTDEVSIQGYITTDIGLTKDLSFTSYFLPAGGNTLSNIPGRGETLAPGASKQFSFGPSNLQIQKDPKPVYLIIINRYGGPKESNTTNNNASTTILFN